MVKKILIADDDESVGLLLKDNFSIKGYSVVIVKNGEEVLKSITSEKPDLLILDIKMPKLDGFSVHALMQGTEEFRKIPIIMISGDSEMQKLFFGAEPAQVIACYEKPFDVEKLLSEVERLFTRLV